MSLQRSLQIFQRLPWDLLRYMPCICGEREVKTSDGKRPVIYTLGHTFASLLAREVPRVDAGALAVAQVSRKRSR